MAQPDKSAARRGQLAVRIASVMLEDGVASLPLRDLAARLETSDRMLLYYFGTQAELVRAALAQLSGLLAARLEGALPSQRMPAGALLRRLLTVMALPGIAPILKVWADVAARGARGEQPFADFAGGAVTLWRGWIADRLDVPVRVRAKTASALLVVIEGSRMLELSAPGAAKDAAPLLAKAFD